MKLSGKVAVITGAAHGLGQALALELTDCGVNLAAVDNDREGLAALQNQLPDLVTIQADVAKPAELEKILREAVKIQGQVDLWINNAGILGDDGPALGQSFDSIHDVLAINAEALINGSIIAGRYFQDHPGGWIVNILSTSALAIRPGRSVYSASKHAGHAFTQALKKELTGPKVLAVYPDGIKTELFGDQPPEDYDDFMAPEYVAQKIVAAIERDRVKDLVIRRPGG